MRGTLMARPTFVEQNSVLVANPDELDEAIHALDLEEK
jgi:hypothetical protein